MISEHHQPAASVLVVGGGIGGMRAAVDLAEAGLKVYLTRKGSRTGRTGCPAGLYVPHPRLRSMPRNFRPWLRLHQAGHITRIPWIIIVIPILK